MMMIMRGKYCHSEQSVEWRGSMSLSKAVMLAYRSFIVHDILPMAVTISAIQFYNLILIQDLIELFTLLVIVVIEVTREKLRRKFLRS